jgi:hypothetical protein
VKITQYLNFNQQFTGQKFVAIYVAKFQNVLDVICRVLLSISVERYTKGSRERAYTETEVLMGVVRGLENTMNDLTHSITSYIIIQGCVITGRNRSSLGTLLSM